jgi:hypothetical protein
MTPSKLDILRLKVTKIIELRSRSFVNLITENECGSCKYDRLLKGFSKHTAYTNHFSLLKTIKGGFYNVLNRPGDTLLQRETNNISVTHLPGIDLHIGDSNCFWQSQGNPSTRNVASNDGVNVFNHTVERSFDRAGRCRILHTADRTTYK